MNKRDLTDSDSVPVPGSGLPCGLENKGGMSVGGLGALKYGSVLPNRSKATLCGPLLLAIIALERSPAFFQSGVRLGSNTVLWGSYRLCRRGCSSD